MPESLGSDLKSKRLRKRADYVFHQDYRSRWSDNDMFHHLNNPVYGVLIDSIINAYLMDRCGYSTSSSPRIGLVATTYCDYFGSAKYPGMLNVGLRVVKMGKSSVMYEVGVFQEGDGAVKAVGGFSQIWVDRKTNRPTPDGIQKHIKQELLKLINTDVERESAKAKL